MMDSVDKEVLSSTLNRFCSAELMEAVDRTAPSSCRFDLAGDVWRRSDVTREERRGYKRREVKRLQEDRRGG